jgi:hypothetical protein
MKGRSRSGIDYIDRSIQIAVYGAYLRDHPPIADTFELVETQPVIG